MVSSLSMFIFVVFIASLVSFQENFCFPLTFIFVVNSTSLSLLKSFSPLTNISPFSIVKLSSYLSFFAFFIFILFVAFGFFGSFFIFAFFSSFLIFVFSVFIVLSICGSSFIWTVFSQWTFSFWAISKFSKWGSIFE